MLKHKDRSMKSSSQLPHVTEDIAEPTVPGTSMTYLGGRSLRRYTIWITIGMFIIMAVMQAISGILLPNQIQEFQFAHYFTGTDAKVDLAELSNLKTAVDQGASVTAEQERLLGIYRQFDASRAQVLSWVSSITAILTMLVVPVIGVISDRTRTRLGRRNPWILIGGIAAALCLVLVGFATSITVMVILIALIFATLNFQLGPMNASVADRTTESVRGKISGASALGTMVGSIFGSVAAGILFASLGFNLYIVLAVALIVGTVLFVIRTKDRPSTALQLEPFSWINFFKGFLVPLRDRDFLFIWIARLVLIFGNTIPQTLSFYMMQSYIHPALSAAEATRLVPVLGMTMLPFMIIATVISGSLSDKVGRRKPFVVFASLLMAASFVIPLVWPSLPALFIQTALGGLAFGIFMPVDQALFIDVLPDKKSAGRDLGIANVATNLGQALGPIMAGQIVVLSGGYDMIWAVGVVVVFVAAFIVLPVKRAR